MSASISRRGFLTSAAVGGAGLLAATALAGCQAETLSKTGVEEKLTWKNKPAPIEESSIVETILCDVAVIGAGDAGLMASLAASEQGADVIMIDKHKKFMAHGLAHACIGTSVHKAAGLDFDKDKIVRYLTIQSNNRADQRLVRLWADESGAIYDRIIEIATNAGVACIPMMGGNPSDPYHPEFECALMFMGEGEIEKEEGEDEGAVAQTWLFQAIEDEVKKNGVDIRYNTTAVQLERMEDGSVKSVVALDENGEYFRIEVTKGVVLATGDYGNDPDMVAEYCPWQTLADVNFYTPPINTGDGHKMGLWIGAAMQAAPHCPALHPERVVGPTEPPIGASPVLRVNIFGERYENEEVPAPLVCEGRIRQPGNIAWAIVDSNWQTDAPSMTPGLLRTFAPNDLNVEMFEASAAKADTLEDLAQAIGVPADTFTATVERYTELAQKGVDEDFGKSSNNLWPIVQPPFYAIEVPTGTMNTLGGLLVNTNMQVLDGEKEGEEPIPGLYAGGNVSGGFFGSTYPSAVSGINKGWSIVGGYLAGLHAATDN